MPTFKLNGRAVEFEPGELIIEAAARAEVPIPYYCYHPDLSQPANCRMCLVEMVGAPKLIPSCQQPVNERMEILTDSEKVVAARRDVMEYLLVNHPLDCPICDQAGECKLQQYAYLFGPSMSSMEEVKVELDKRKRVGPHVVLDQERCISCTRCVRFLHEVTGTGELTMVSRSNHITVDVHPERQVDNPYAGNVVDMCPVGALTDRDFRFASRVWYLQAVDSTCGLCSRGCNVTLDWKGQRKGRPTVERIRARRNPGVNRSWICDEGRSAWRTVRGDRPHRARGAVDGLDAAVTRAAELVGGHAGGTGWLGVLASGAETTEELHALASWARAADAEAVLAVPAVEDGDEDDLLRRLDKAANRQGARLVGFGDDLGALSGRALVLVIDADLRPDGGLEGAVVAAARGEADVIAFAAAPRGWTTGAAAFFPLANAFEKEGTFVNCDGIVQRVSRVVPAPGDARPVHHHCRAIAEAAGLAAPAAEAESLLAELVAPGGALAGLDPSRLGPWGARLAGDGSEAIEYLPAPPALFTSAPRSYAEGEYLPFLRTSTPPPAVHVAAGSPTPVRLGDPRAGAGVPLPVVSSTEGEGVEAPTDPEDAS